MQVRKKKKKLIRENFLAGWVGWGWEIAGKDDLRCQRGRKGSFFRGGREGGVKNETTPKADAANDLSSQQTIRFAKANGDSRLR